ncbi:MAG: hypothetical protein ACLGIC_04060 [Acidimicrobiia bacterium]
MRSPWRSVQPLEADREYVALVTDIPPQRLSSTGRWFRGASEVKAQLPETDGVVGYTLAASPLRKQYRTLSVWTDEEAMATFARSGAHGRLVRELSGEMGHTRFVRWTFAGRAGRPRWRDAMRRLESEPTASHPKHRSNER